MAQLVGTLIGVTIALIGGFILYGVLKAAVGIRMSEEEEFDGADLSIHKIGSTPDEDLSRR
jgi:Amt family ammonium transporter